MFLPTNATDGGGYPLFIAVEEAQKLRLRGTCFRGTEHRLAGNFCRWKSCEDVLAEKDVLELILQGVRKKMHNKVTHSINVDTGSIVGWSSTDDAYKYVQEELEDYKLPNGKSHGLRVKQGAGIMAPTTTLITFVYFTEKESDKTVIHIVSIYPGKDIGPLSGNITKNARCVFFDWNNPGAEF